MLVKLASFELVLKAEIEPGEAADKDPMVDRLFALKRLRVFLLNNPSHR